MAMGGAKIMWKYVKSLEYPVNIKKKDLRMAKYLVTQYGGANGELAAAFRYLNQRYTMPDDKGKALLTDIGTEELAHVEMISAMIYQLLNGATLKELKEAGLESHYAEHGYGLYPTDSNGVPFTVSYFATFSICCTLDSVELVPNGKSVTGQSIVSDPFTYGSQSSIYPGLMQIVAHPSFTPSFVKSIISSSVNSGFNTE